MATSSNTSLCSRQSRIVGAEVQSHSMFFCGMDFHKTQRRSGLPYGKGRRSTPSITLKIAVFAPIPIARIRRTVAVNPGDRLSRRNACFRSVAIDSTIDHSQTAVLLDGAPATRIAQNPASDVPAQALE